MATKANPEAGFSATVKAMGDDLGHRRRRGDVSRCYLTRLRATDVTMAYPRRRRTRWRRCRPGSAAFFAVVLHNGLQVYGPQMGSLAIATDGEPPSV